MSIPKEPRQQMINIMYLVLIALLALNVSAEILNAFRMLNRSIDSSNNTLAGKIDKTMDSFKAKVEEENRGQGKMISNLLEYYQVPIGESLVSVR